MTSEKKKNLSIVYFSIGALLIIWGYVGSYLLNSNEPMLGALWMIAILGFPLSIPFSAFLMEGVNYIAPGKGYDFVPMLIILLFGYFQWFYILPWIVKFYNKMKRKK